MQLDFSSGQPRDVSTVYKGERIAYNVQSTAYKGESTTYNAKTTE